MITNIKRTLPSYFLGVAFALLLAVNGLNVYIAGIIGGLLAFLLKNTIAVSIFPDENE